MKLKPRRIVKKEKVRYLDALYTAISTLSSRGEVKEFLRQLLTESERIMIGRRIIIAQKLLAGESYSQIMDELHVGVDTIMRVHRWLGEAGTAYEKTILKLEKAYNKRFKKNGDKGGAEWGSFAWLKKRYPLHFLLFNLFDKVGK
jgi:uncharacterized protein YerC